MLPRPTTPSVFPVISTPMNFFFSHSPFFMLAVDWGSFRARANRYPTASSAAAMELPEGVLITCTLRSVAALTSMLSTPTPARPTIFRLVARPSRSAVTFVAERTARP